jgi:lipoprotein-releasing system permease protein
MRKPIALFVGLRYLRARKGSGFVSFVTFASVLGVALGVATLILVLSVMNGFETELRERLLGLTAHASVRSENGIESWQEVMESLVDAEGIVGAAPYIEQEVMLSGAGGLAGAELTGILPAAEQTVSKIHSHMQVGSLDDLQPQQYRIVLGRALAQRLGVEVGDSLALLVPRMTDGNSASFAPELRSYSVSGIFELGVLDHDSVRAFIHLDDARELAGAVKRVDGLRVETNDIFAAPELVRRWLADSGRANELEVWDWTQQNASYFRAIRLEKTMMALLLSLIIGVAAFNIVATLVMVVTEKRSGIAILRTIGCSRRDVVAIFILQGTLIGWLGAIIGITLGVFLALNIDTIAPALENLLGFQFMPADLYYLTALPSELRIVDVVLTSLVVLIVTALATVYPSLRAANVQPAEVLRYE